MEVGLLGREGGLEDQVGPIPVATQEQLPVGRREHLYILNETQSRQAMQSAQHPHTGVYRPGLHDGWYLGHNV